MTDGDKGDDEPGGDTDTRGAGSDDAAAEPSGIERTEAPDEMLAEAATGADDERHDGPPWYRSTLGIGLAGANLVLLLLLVFASAEGGPLGNVATGAGNTGLWGTMSTTGVGVPWYVYIFGAVGALGFVFTTLVVDFDQSAESFARMCLRIPAALPLAAGIYLLSQQFLGDQIPKQLTAGLAFLAGLYVDLTYRRLDDVARRLLPDSGSDGSESGVEDSKSEAGDTADETDAVGDETTDAGDEPSDTGDQTGDGGDGTEDAGDGSQSGNSDGTEPEQESDDGSGTGAG